MTINGDAAGAMNPPPVENQVAPLAQALVSVQSEVDALLPESKGQVGLVARCIINDGITDRKAIVAAGAAANTSAVANIQTAIRAIRFGDVPDSAPTVARQAASSARSFLKQHRAVLSEEAVQHLDEVIERLTDAAENKQAQEQEEAELQSKGEDLENVLAEEGGVYVYTYPHYWRYPTAEGTNRTFLKVGMTTKEAKVRVRQQANVTAAPEAPLILRVYQHPSRSPRDLERDFHDLLDAADHYRGTGGKEWFETSVEFLDVVAEKLGLTSLGVDDEESQGPG